MIEEKEIEHPFLKGKYIIKDILGKGSFGKVYHAIVAETGSDVAIKEIKIPKKPREYYQRTYDLITEEVFILKTITRNKITCSVSLLDTIHGKDEESEYDYYFIVLSYYNGYSFMEFIKNNNYHSEEIKINILRWFCEVRNCLDTLHNLHIYHRDIKPVNIMLHDGEPKLIDFGLALRIGDEPDPIKLGGTVKYFSKYYIKLTQSKVKDIKRQRSVLRFQDYWALLMSFYFIYTNQEIYHYYDDYSDPIGPPQMKDKILVDKYDNFKPNKRDPYISMMERVIDLIKENDSPTQEMFEIIENFNI